MKRRTFITSLAAASAGATSIPTVQAANYKKNPSNQDFKVLSPPVVQNPTETSFSVSWMISGMATGWVEWGTTEKLGKIAKPAHHGLMGMSEYALSASITNIPKGSAVFYRVVTMPVHYKNAYSIEKSTPILGEIRQLKLPSASADTLTNIASTHPTKHFLSIKSLEEAQK